MCLSQLRTRSIFNLQRRVEVGTIMQHNGASRTNNTLSRLTSSLRQDASASSRPLYTTSISPSLVGDRLPQIAA